MKNRFGRIFSKKGLMYIKYVPLIIRDIENWFQFILNYSKIKNEPRKYKFRNGLELMTNEGVDTSTIAVIFIKKDYGNMDEKKVIIDIGTNIGVFAVFAAYSQKNAQIYAYEPMPKSYDLLVKNIGLNNMQNIIHPFMLGVSGKKEKRKLFLGEGSPFHSLYQKNGAGDFLEVQCITLNDIFKQNKINNCDLLKMDCEGAEFDIIYNTKPEYFDKIREIRLEYHCFEKGRTPKELVDFLKDKGFRLTKFNKSTSLCGDAWFEKIL